MFCLKRNLANRLFSLNIYRFAYSLNLYDIFWSKFTFLAGCLFFLFLISILHCFNTYNLNNISLCTLFYNRFTCECHIYKTTSTPHLSIKKFISKPQINIISHN